VGAALNRLKLDDLNDLVLKSFGLDKHGEAPNKILQSAMEKYAVENKNGFREKIMELNNKYNRAMQAAVEGTPNVNALINSIRVEGEDANKEKAAKKKD